MSNLTNNQPKIAAFVCNWCSYAGADAAGTSRLQYDDSVRIIRFPCTGRIDSTFILKAFEQDVDGVLVSGCHPGDCHYATGNLYARRRFNVFRTLMQFLGLDERRLQFSWVSAAEGAKWADVVNRVSKDVKELIGDGFRWARPFPPSELELNQPASSVSARQHTSSIMARPPKRSGERAGGPSQPVGPAVSGVAEKIKAIGDAAKRSLDDVETTAHERLMTDQLRRRSRELLESKRVDAFLGYAEGVIPGTTTPCFAMASEATDRFVWNRSCRNNLSVYLTRPLVRKLGRIGIAAKPCDARAIVGLIQENQLKREDVFILGLACDGVVERERLAAKCLACQERVPTLCDEIIGQPRSEGTLPPTNPIGEAIELLEKAAPQERWNFWQSEFERCIRCYACRAVCPFCYCETCISDKHRPQWIPESPRPEGNLAWNIVRAMHLAGRCIGCNECARACPAGIRLDLINNKLALEIQREFDYQAGAAVDVAPPLATYRPDDSQEFIR
jgi:coenzyme F420-reducing hydrogenase delta subunit/ferredoxin